MTPVPRLRRQRSLRAAVPGGLLFVGLLGFCGGSRGPAITATVRERPVPQWSARIAAKRVRVLLAEGFSNLAVGETRDGRIAAALAVDGGVSLRDGRGRELERGDGFRVEPTPGRLIRVQGRTYHGAVEIFVNPLGVPVVVNETGIEDYLRGVVPNELSPRLFPHGEALKAQAVAARTYTVSGLGGRARAGFDLYSDQRSQVYGGVAGEDPVSDLAVAQTRGKIAVHRGKPIAALYSSTCGGRTANYTDFFQGGEIPYLKGGVVCQDGSSRYHRWTETKRIADLEASLGRYAGVGRLKGLKIRRRAPDGRVLEMDFEGPRETRTLKGFDLRFALGLRSNWIKKMVLDRDEEGFVRAVTVEGAGFGHGVGLCQIGAVELAQKGVSHERILGRYYPGTRVSQAY